VALDHGITAWPATLPAVCRGALVAVFVDTSCPQSDDPWASPTMVQLGTEASHGRHRVGRCRGRQTTLQCNLHSNNWAPLSSIWECATTKPIECKILSLMGIAQRRRPRPMPKCATCRPLLSIRLQCSPSLSRSSSPDYSCRLNNL
jgi:hypothetical protein